MCLWWSGLSFPHQDITKDSWAWIILHFLTMVPCDSHSRILSLLRIICLSVSCKPATSSVSPFGHISIFDNTCREGVLDPSSFVLIKPLNQHRTSCGFDFNMVASFTALGTFYLGVGFLKAYLWRHILGEDACFPTCVWCHEIMRLAEFIAELCLCTIEHASNATSD